MERISEAVLGKVEVEAQNIIREAQEQAQTEKERAQKLREERFQEEKDKRLQEAEEEAARIIAQSSIEARKNLSITKNNVIAGIIDMVKQKLSESSSNENHLLNLITEAIDGIRVDKSRIYVSSKDMSCARNLLKGDRTLASKIVEVNEGNFTGGVIAENIDGSFRIDNTYETRLEMLLPQLLPKLSKELFEAS